MKKLIKGTLILDENKLKESVLGEGGKSPLLFSFLSDIMFVKK